MSEPETRSGAPRLYVDADACPVRPECLRVAERHGVEAVLVSNGGIRPSAHPGARVVVVDQGADAADRWIADRTRPGDVCVTADIVLADRVVKPGARVLKPNGEALTPANIGQALAMRDLMADLRAAAPLAAGGGGRAFSKADRSRFLDALDRALRAAARDGRDA
ncbi:MAG: YaiI/YqxD family protein [Paracoccaceae bacterium]